MGYEDEEGYGYRGSGEGLKFIFIVGLNLAIIIVICRLLYVPGFPEELKDTAALMASVEKPSTRQLPAENRREMQQTNEVTQDITVDSILFFDMDGTLIDTDLANFLSYKKAINSVIKSDHNLTYNPDKRFNRSNLNNAVPNLTESEYEKIIQEKEEYYNDFIQSDTEGLLLISWAQGMHFGFLDQT